MPELQSKQADLLNHQFWTATTEEKKRYWPQNDNDGGKCRWRNEEKYMEHEMLLQGVEGHLCGPACGQRGAKTVTWLRQMSSYDLVNEISQKVLVHQLWPTLCNPMDCSPPGSSVHRILQARILEWVAISFSRGSSKPRNQTRVS